MIIPLNWNFYHLNRSIKLKMETADLLKQLERFDYGKNTHPRSRTYFIKIARIIQRRKKL
jgi:hypothetical protein